MQNHHPSRRARRRRQLQPVTLQPGQVAFRVVCHNSIIGGVIGHSGSVISQIRSQTGCVLHCEEPVRGAEHRVIWIVGPVTPGRKIAIAPMDGGEEEEVEVVSVAQEAVVRVCERMWEVDSRNRGVQRSDGGMKSEGYCGMLADGTQIGAVVGKGGRNVMRMRRESGARIMMLPAPLCAAKGDELIQITGDILAVKRALVAVTECLHDCPPQSNSQFLYARPVDTASRVASSDPHAEFFPHLSPLLPAMNGHASYSNAFSSDADFGDRQDMKSKQQQVSFRLLCSNGAAGSIIGQKGSIVRTLQNGTGASIIFAPPKTDSGERLVTISAFENLESWYSPAQNAVVLVFARSVEHDIEMRHSSGLVECTTVTARLLVASDNVCCLKGKDEGVDTEITEASGAKIQILEEEPISDFSLENDVVVEITGEYINVQKALLIATGKLRDSLLPSEVLNEVRARNPKGAMQIASIAMQRPSLLPLDSNRDTSLARRVDQLQLSSSLHHSSSPELHPLEESAFPLSHSSPGVICDPCKNTKLDGNNKPKFSGIALPHQLIMRQTAVKGSSASGANIDSDSLQRRPELPTIAYTKVEFIIPEDMLGSVYGENGINLDRLGQISGAKVDMCDPSPSKSERKLIISGTPDQTRAAQSLLQAYISADH